MTLYNELEDIPVVRDCGDTMQHHEEDQDLGGQFQMMHGRLQYFQCSCAKDMGKKESISMSKIAFQKSRRVIEPNDTTKSFQIFHWKSNSTHFQRFQTSGQQLQKVLAMSLFFTQTLTPLHSLCYRLLPSTTCDIITLLQI